MYMPLRKIHFMKQLYLLCLLSITNLNFTLQLNATHTKKVEPLLSLRPKANLRMDVANLQQLDASIIELIAEYAGFRENNWTLLKDAIICGNFKDIQTLIAWGAKVNNSDQGYMQTVIHRYTWHNKNLLERENYERIFYYLLYKKIDLKLKDKNLNSALHCAADSAACLPIFKILIKKLKRSDPEQPLDVPNARGSTISDIIEKNLEFQSSQLACRKLNTMKALLNLNA